MSVHILTGDCRDVLPSLPDKSVDLCVTSPPFWRQRDYEHPGQFGAERTPQEYAERLVEAFAAMRPKLVDTGAVFLELGDTYAAGGNGGGGSRAARRTKLTSLQARTGWRSPPSGYKEKDLSLSPFVAVDMLRADGWFLRKTIIWDKGTATEPPRMDRPSVSHSYVFLLSKRPDSHVRDPGGGWWQSSVWRIPPNGHGNEHPAPMAPLLVERCILAGCPAGGMVLDLFGGGGTTGVVAQRLGRRATLIELNPAYAEIAERRIRNADVGLPFDAAA